MKKGITPQHQGRMVQVDTTPSGVAVYELLTDAEMSEPRCKHCGSPLGKQKPGCSECQINHSLRFSFDRLFMTEKPIS
jgi:uncharacterized Zn finger protein (UPF0148 family)